MIDNPLLQNYRIILLNLSQPRRDLDTNSVYLKILFSPVGAASMWQWNLRTTLQQSGKNPKNIVSYRKEIDSEAEDKPKTVIILRGLERNSKIT